MQGVFAPEQTRVRAHSEAGTSTTGDPRPHRHIGTKEYFMKAITARGALALSIAALLAASLAGCVADDSGNGNAGGSTDKGDLQCGLANGEAATGDPIEV